MCIKNVKTMDDFLNANSNKDNTFQEKKKISIKHRKIKRATRTFLYNIDHWLNNQEIKEAQKKLKKKLGTSSQILKDEEGTALTFNGDHTQEIQQMMIEISNKLDTKSFA